MANIDPVAYARELIEQRRHLDATYLLEATLLVNAGDHSARLLLARLYIVLKENHYRARARVHLERLVNSGAPTEIAKAAAGFLIKNVYLTNGPIERARPLLEAHPGYFSTEDAIGIANKIDEIDKYLKVPAKGRRRSAPPVYPAQVANLDVALKGFIFKEFEAQVVGKDTRGSYFTFGSCFAGNVARAMSAAGVSVESFWVGEEVNTTFSNLNLLRFILGEEVAHSEYYHSVLAGHDVGRLRSSLMTAQNVIYTLGVAPAFFENGTRYLPHTPANLRILLKSEAAIYRFSTVEENVRELETMGDLLRKHTQVRNVFLTVSPVPMAASLQSAAAAVDDSESKSILRTAAGVMCRKDAELFTYFPSFEAFRWLPSFRGEAAFGRDDGSLRHVNSDMVDRVVAAFMTSARVLPNVA